MQNSAVIGTNGNPIWELGTAKIKARRSTESKARQELVAHWHSKMTPEFNLGDFHPCFDLPGSSESRDS